VYGSPGDCKGKVMQRKVAPKRTAKTSAVESVASERIDLKMDILCDEPLDIREIVNYIG
jgi:hypothetical protein